MTAHHAFFVVILVGFVNQFHFEAIGEQLCSGDMQPQHHDRTCVVLTEKAETANAAA